MRSKNDSLCGASKSSLLGRAQPVIPPNINEHNSLGSQVKSSNLTGDTREIFVSNSLTRARLACHTLQTRRAALPPAALPPARLCLLPPALPLRESNETSVGIAT